MGERSTRIRPINWLPVVCGAIVALLPATFGKVSESRPGTACRTAWADYGFTSTGEVEDFLAHARVTAMDTLPVGINRTKKMRLESDGRSLYAVFRSVERFQTRRWIGDRLYMNFRDSARFELVAYRLARLLGLDNIPPVVARRFQPADFPRRSLYEELDRKEGTLQLWIPDAMTELQRRRAGISPPNPTAWNAQMQMMRLFDRLIANIDRNQGNILIGPDWKVWFIDSTRAFRPLRWLQDAGELSRCDRRLWARLQEIGEEDLRRELGDLLAPSELRCLNLRWQALIRHFQLLIAERGETEVLTDWSGPTSPAAPPPLQARLK